MKTKKSLSAFIFVSITILIPYLIYAQQMPDYTGQVFPLNHALNMPIDALPVHTNSNNYVASIGAATGIHPDFGTYYEGRSMGISYNLVGQGQAMISLTFEYESDPGPYPIPIPPLVEGLNYFTDDDEGDRHILVIDTSAKKLYETWYTWPAGHSMEEPEDWDTFPPDNPSDWWAGGGAVFDLTSNALREDGWTSADAAGLPIFPLLIRYDEVERALAGDGVIHHAIRFTVRTTQRAYIWPARHYASSSTDQNRPPMGLRFRLKADVDISRFSPRMQVILQTMKKYGIIVADNGGNWFFQGTHDDRWDDDEINSLKSIQGSDFEAVDISEWMSRPGFDINSAAVPPASGTSVMPALNADVPDNFILYQNYPNPFNPNTVISYKLKEKSNVKIIVYDILGRKIAVLVNEMKSAGDYTVEWNGMNSSGQKAGSGVYLYKMQAGAFSQFKKLILLR
ncbi:MAG: T9SS type A sorting domain-containing protein [Bacteroidetes bacterium]|nr:T9SS type A sorting domain-containing protein [Bacteroidota bacterium]